MLMYSTGSKLRGYQCHYFRQQTSTKVRKKRRRVSIPILLLDLLLLLSVWRLPSCLPAQCSPTLLDLAANFRSSVLNRGRRYSPQSAAAPIGSFGVHL